MMIGFIGLGIMGAPMAINLLKAGYDLVVYDILPERIELVSRKGAEKARSAAEIAGKSDVIITMLPNSPHVKEAVMGAGGVLDGAKPETILVDMSSIAPLASKEISEACAKKGVVMLDAPVSGGEPKAIDGTLSIMVGGKKETFEAVYDILMTMGANCVLCGEIGAGNTTKLVNQIIVALNIAAVGEALALGVKAGVNPELIFNAIKGGLAGSTVLSAKAPMVMNGDFKPGFKIDLHIKDLQNALDTGHAVGVPLPLSAYAMEIMQLLKSEGYGQEDHCAIVKYYEKLSGIKVRKQS